MHILLLSFSVASDFDTFFVFFCFQVRINNETVALKCCVVWLATRQQWTLFCLEMYTRLHSMKMICGDSYAPEWGGFLVMMFSSRYRTNEHLCMWTYDSSHRPEPVTSRAWSCALINSEYVIRVCRGFRTENALNLLPCSQSHTLHTHTSAVSFSMLTLPLRFTCGEKS